MADYLHTVCAGLALLLRICSLKSPIEVHPALLYQKSWITIPVLTANLVFSSTVLHHLGFFQALTERKKKINFFSCKLCIHSYKLVVKNAKHISQVLPIISI